MAQQFASPVQNQPYGAPAPSPAAANPFDPMAAPPADPFAMAPPITPTVASGPGTVPFAATPPVPQQQPQQQQPHQQPVPQQYGAPQQQPSPVNQYAGMVSPQQQQAPPQQVAPHQQALVPAAQQSNQWGIAPPAPAPAPVALFDPFAPAPPAPAPAPPAQAPADPWASQGQAAPAQQPPPPDASQQQLVVSPWEQQAQQPPPQYLPPAPAAPAPVSPPKAPVSEVNAAVPSSGVSAVSEPPEFKRNTEQPQMTSYTGAANANGNMNDTGKENGNGNTLHLEKSQENKYANMLARQAPPGASPLPRAELVRKSGYVLSRISFRTIIMKSWKQSYWIQYGPHTMLWFRSQEDFKDWLNNPYHSQAQRNYLIKLAVNFVHDLYRPNVRGYQVTQSTTKAYGREMMKQFKLERWMDYGPTIAAAFASQDPKEVDTLRETIVQCMRNTPTDHGIRHTGAVRQDYQETPNGGERYQNYTYDSTGEAARHQRGDRDDRSYSSEQPMQTQSADGAESNTQTSAPAVADLLGGDDNAFAAPPAPLASPALSAPPAYQQPPVGVPQQAAGYQQPQQQAPLPQQQYAGYQQAQTPQAYPQYQQQQQHY